MSFTDVVQHLGTTRVVAVVTSRADGSQAATPIWSVVVDGVPYVRSAFGAGSKWYQHATSGREVRFAMGDGKVAEQDRAAALAQLSEPVGVELVPTDDAVQQAVSDAVAAKYSDEPSSVTPMLSDEAIGCTLRVLAR